MSYKKSIIVFIVIVFSLFFVFSCAHSRPPKPGPNFQWVKPVKTNSGNIIPGHWVYKGALKPGKTWVPTHLNNSGNVVPGHWKNIKPLKKKNTWIPGHHGPKGRWIPGHWK